MRRIMSAGERLSPHRLPRTRPGATETCLYNPQGLITINLTERTREASSLGPPRSRQWNCSNPHRDHTFHERASTREFSPTAKHPDIDVATPEAIQTPTKEYDEVIPPTWNSPEEETEHAQGFFRALQNGQPDQIMNALTDPRSAGLVGSLPQTIFIEALHRLSPTHFVEPFRDLHHPLHAWSVLKNGLKRVEEIFDEFVRNLFTITRYRMAAGHSLQLDEYRHLLDCARSMGNEALADQLWDSMEREGISPDGLCYNHYMETKVWNHCYTGHEAYRLRMLPFHYLKRRMDDRNVGWKGFGTAKQSVRKEVTLLFRQMIDDGHLGDERAYINIILASARVGHKLGVRHVLKTVWNIDVNALKGQYDNSKLPPPTRYDPWSALYPTENLLFAVAHALGTTNDIAGAVRTVEFISTSYDIPIPAKVWHELLERAYVLCRTRTTPTVREQRANEIGKVSMDLVRSLFDTMTSEPYNIKPTMQILRFMVNISIDSGSLEDSKFYLDEAYKLLQESRTKQEEARAVILRCLVPVLEAADAQTQNGANPDPSLFQSPVLAEAIHAYDILRLQVYQEVYLLQRTLWILVRVPHWKDTPDENWLYQERPKMQQEWWDFIPARKRLFYDENVVDMAGSTGFKDRRWGSKKYIPVRRRTDHENLFEPTEPERRVPEETDRWRAFAARYPVLDTNVAPVNRLFTFELSSTPEFKKMLAKLRNTWVDYPEDHPQSTKNNPSGGFYGRLAALGMLKPKERSVYLLDDVSWI